MRRFRFDNLKNAALFDAENPVCKAGRYSTDSQRFQILLIIRKPAF
jgi:hypothetical protein